MTIQHNDANKLVVAAKLLMGIITVNEKIEDPDSYIKANQAFDADFVASVCTWQGHHNVTPDGIIGPETWAAIGAVQPVCSTSKNRISGQTMALQILLDTQITCDGVYGNRTKQAVAVYQDAKGLKADGICGKKTWAALLTEVYAEPVEEPVPEVTAELNENGAVVTAAFKSTVNYKQHDSRWGKKVYTSCGNKSQTMSNSGCGPTAMANVIATLVDSKVTPWDLAQLAMKWGDRTKNSGTATSFFRHIQEYYKFKKMVGTGSLDVLKACLDAGGYVVCRMGAGYWTNGGHYITAWKYDKEYIYCNDPSSPTSKRSERKKQKQSDFLKQRKDFWCFWPEREGQAIHPPDDTGTKAIVDISKHDGNIDFATLSKHVSLVIARCSLGSDIDVRFNVYAASMNENNIPFGVYCYSYARDIAKAKDEARKMLNYAKRYKPLFYVIDAEEPCITRETLEAFVDALRDLGVKRIGCYVAHHRYKDYQYDKVRDKVDFTWIPRYGLNNGTIEGSTIPKYACDLWQYTSEGWLEGFRKGESVDLNVITGTGHDLAWFLEKVDE